MIINHQITLKEKKLVYYNELLKEECTSWPVGSKVKIIPLHAYTGILGSRISRQQAHDGGKAVILTHRSSLPPSHRIITLELIAVRN